MTDDRSAFTEARDAGLAKRHETREARAIRRQVAEEIAQALEQVPMPPVDTQTLFARGVEVALIKAARIAREIGAEETS